ncbi:MAG: hypothetical protein HY820_29880 [Acidobacteria bacterium]|nr:hypothetical protein [Acidobacteriota bacterium]
MQLALHIFKKDMRHLWWQVLLGYVLAAVIMGFGSQPSHMGGVPFMLMIILWGVVISRVAIQEPLASERSYWLTRPIPRMQLLVAKALFLAVAIQLPVLVLDCLVLARNGYSVATYWSGLAVKQAILLSTLVLPLFAIALVTRSLGQYLSVAAALGVIVVALGNVPGPLVIHSEVAWVILAAGRLLVLLTLSFLCLALFRKRKIRQGRIGLCALALGLVLLCYLAPYSTVFAVQERFSRQPEPPVSFELDTHRRPATVPDVRGWVAPGEHRFDLALRVPEGFESVLPLRQTASVILTDGTRWKSAVASHFYFGYSPARVDRPTISITVKDDEDYRKYRDRPVIVRAQLYMVRVKQSQQGEFTLPHGSTNVAGLGVCRAKQLERMLYLYCESPLKDPGGYESRLITRDGRELTGRSSQIRHYSPLPAENLFSTMTHATTGWFRMGELLAYNEVQDAQAHIKAYEAVAHFRSELTIDGIRLGDYEVRQR